MRRLFMSYNIYIAVFTKIVGVSWTICLGHIQRAKATKVSTQIPVAESGLPSPAPNQTTAATNVHLTHDSLSRCFKWSTGFLQAPAPITWSPTNKRQQKRKFLTAGYSSLQENWASSGDIYLTPKFQNHPPECFFSGVSQEPDWQHSPSACLSWS